MSTDPTDRAFTSVQQLAVIGDHNEHSANSDDRQPQPLTVDVVPRSRGLKSRLRSFYSTLRFRTEVDPLALVLFLGGLVPGSIALWHWITPPSIEVVPPDVVMYVAEDQLGRGNQPLKVLRLTAAFSFRNTHPTKSNEVASISAKLTIGKKVAKYRAGSYVHTYRDEDDNKRLRFNQIGDAGPISIPPDSATETKEIFFWAEPSETSDKFQNALSIDEFTKLAKDNKSKIEFFIKSKNEEYVVEIRPTSEQIIAEHLNSKYPWDSQTGLVKVSKK